MKAKSFRPTEKPEERIQRLITEFLRIRDWLVRSTHGNIYQMGFPDLFCAHRKYGIRWVEVKNPISYSFTPAQVEFFPRMYAHGVGVWVLVDATEYEYQKLFQPCNYHAYMMAKL